MRAGSDFQVADTAHPDNKPTIPIDTDRLNFWAEVDREIERLRGPDCPCALWPKEIEPIYRPGLSAVEAAQLILERRIVRSAALVAPRRNGPIARIYGFWRGRGPCRPLVRLGRGA